MFSSSGHGSSESRDNPRSAEREAGMYPGQDATFTHLRQFSIANPPTGMFLRVGRKPGNLEETHTDMWKNMSCNLRKESLNYSVFCVVLLCKYRSDAVISNTGGIISILWKVLLKYTCSVITCWIIFSCPILTFEQGTAYTGVEYTDYFHFAQDKNSTSQYFKDSFIFSKSLFLVRVMVDQEQKETYMSGTISH